MIRPNEPDFKERERESYGGRERERESVCERGTQVMMQRFFIEAK